MSSTVSGAVVTLVTAVTCLASTSLPAQEKNLVAAANGAQVIKYTSQLGGEWRAEKLIDEQITAAGWASVDPGCDPGPALASVVYTSVVIVICSWGSPCGPGPTWIWVTLTARGSVSSLNRNSSTEKKSPLRRWLSRIGMLVSTEVGSIETSTQDSSGVGPTWMAPEKSVNRPRTFDSPM